LNSLDIGPTATVNLEALTVARKVKKQIVK
jgi:hypothetical protein